MFRTVSYDKRNTLKLAMIRGGGMKLWILVLVMTVVLASCAKEPAYDPAETAKTLVLRELKDPDSATWGAIKATKFHDGYVACGTVNAKNAFGAYAGNAHFEAIYKASGEGGATIADSAEMGVIQQAACEIMFEIAARNSDASKWPQEKAELQSRAEKSANELAWKLVRERR